MQRDEKWRENGRQEIYSKLLPFYFFLPPAEWVLPNGHNYGPEIKIKGARG
jgi:hypothetical protein